MIRASVVAAVAAALLAAASAATPARPGSGAVIVYWSEQPWPSIWTVRPGAAPQRILRNRQNAKRPRLSPDRAWVAFDGAPPGKTPLSDFDIQLVRLDGSGLRTVTVTPDWDTDAQWSPDGESLSFTRSAPHPLDCRGASIWIVRRDGSSPRRVGAGCGARWSPDGKRLVFAPPDGHRLLVAPVARGHARAVGPRFAGFVQPAGWSRNGRILFTRSANQTGYSGDVFVVGADGSRLRRLGPGFAAAWSPDGARILFTRSFSSPLLVMDADGTRRHVLVDTPAAEPDWR